MCANLFAQSTDFELAIFCDGSGGRISIYKNSWKRLERERLYLFGFMKHPEKAVYCIEKNPRPWS